MGCLSTSRLHAAALPSFDQIPAAAPTGRAPLPGGQDDLTHGRLRNRPQQQHRLHPRRRDGDGSLWLPFAPRPCSPRTPRRAHRTRRTPRGVGCGCHGRRVVCATAADRDLLQQSSLLLRYGIIGFVSCRRNGSRRWRVLLTRIRSSGPGSSDEGCGRTREEGWNGWKGKQMGYKAQQERGESACQACGKDRESFGLGA